jgi:hypothetical protein
LGCIARPCIKKRKEGRRKGGRGEERGKRGGEKEEGGGGENTYETRTESSQLTPLAYATFPEPRVPGQLGPHTQSFKPKFLSSFCSFSLFFLWSLLE